MKPAKLWSPEEMRDHWGSLNTSWLGRTALAAQWIPNHTSVIDIGCGLMELRKHLNASVKYLGLDVVSRDSNTIIVDLNIDSIPEIVCDYAVVLGVIEYLDDLSAFISKLKVFQRSIVSYNHTTLKDLRFSIFQTHLPDWKNHISKREFRKILGQSGLEILATRSVRWGETLYLLKPR